MEHYGLGTPTSIQLQARSIRVARFARLTRLARFARLTRIARFARLTRLARFAHLTRLARFARFAHLTRIARFAHLTRLSKAHGCHADENLLILNVVKIEIGRHLTWEPTSLIIAFLIS